MTGFANERIDVERRVSDALGIAGQNVRSVSFYLGPHEPPSVTVKVYLSPEQVAAIFKVESTAVASADREEIAEAAEAAAKVRIA